mgnify:CR=1 FL=1
MQLTLYQGVNKRRNSTALPEGSGTIVEVYLKENTSIINPLFVLSGDYLTTNYNYAFFNGRYYWVNDVVQRHNNLIELQCEVDVLATYRLNIKASTAYIKYAATAYNSLIVDNRIPTVMTSRTYARSSSTALFTRSGCAVLQYVSGADNNTVGGGVCADAMYLSSISALCAELYTAGSTIWDELVKQAGSVAECLVSAVYLPIDIGEVSSGSFRAAMIGNYQSTYGNGKPITDRYWTKTKTVTIPWPTNDFRRYSCDISISLPFAGVVKVSPADVFNDSAIDVITIVDKLTGKGIYYLCHNTEDVRAFMSIPFQCGSTICMSSYQNQTLGGVTAAVSAAAATIATGSPMPAVVGIGAVTEKALSFSSSLIGQNSGALSFSTYIDLVLNYCPTAVEPSNITDTLGRPYMAVNALAGFSGYIQTQGFSLTAGLAFGEEKERVNQMLDAGIYLE